jgi:hypothetical protein
VFFAAFWNSAPKLMPSSPALEGGGDRRREPEPCLLLAAFGGRRSIYRRFARVTRNVVVRGAEAPAAFVAVMVAR